MKKQTKTTGIATVLCKPATYAVLMLARERLREEANALFIAVDDKARDR